MSGVPSSPQLALCVVAIPLAPGESPKGLLVRAIAMVRSGHGKAYTVRANVSVGEFLRNACVVVGFRPVYGCCSGGGGHKTESIEDSRDVKVQDRSCCGEWGVITNIDPYILRAGALTLRKIHSFGKDTPAHGLYLESLAAIGLQDKDTIVLGTRKPERKTLPAVKR